GNLEIHLNVDKGIVSDLKIYGDFFGEKDIVDIEKLLKNNRHQEEEIQKILKTIDFEKYFHNISINEFLSALF
ncbi:MAG TPA: lipoate protein ligase C-terminal domain-containing protein, partial [Bacteroidales bacterium]|nr:lipoate protein ligase C-terminal domain-containing protein [Bacteroidales bacterium]